MVAKPECNDSQDWLDKDVQSEKKKRESGYVSSCNDSYCDSEGSNIESKYEASNNDYIKQERIASIFLF